MQATLGLGFQRYLHVKVSMTKANSSGQHIAASFMSHTGSKTGLTHAALASNPGSLICTVNIQHLPADHYPSPQALISAVDAAATAACQQPSTSSDVCVAVLHLLAVVKEGFYVKLLKHLYFNYRRQGLPHDTSNTAAVAAHRSANYQSYVMERLGCF